MSSQDYNITNIHSITSWFSDSQRECYRPPKEILISRRAFYLRKWYFCHLHSYVHALFNKMYNLRTVKKSLI